MCVVFVVHKKYLPALPPSDGNPIPALHLTTAMRRWEHVKELTARSTNAGIQYFKIPLELLLFLKEGNRMKRNRSKESSQRD